MREYIDVEGCYTIIEGIEFRIPLDIDLFICWLLKEEDLVAFVLKDSWDYGRCVA